MSEVLKGSRGSINRRDFLRGTAALAAATLAGPVALAKEQVVKKDYRDKIMEELKQNELLRKVFVNIQKAKDDQFRLELKLNIDGFRKGEVTLKDLRDAISYLLDILPVYNYNLSYKTEGVEAILTAALGVKYMNHMRFIAGKEFLGKAVLGAAGGYFIGRGVSDVLQPKIRKLLQKKVHFKKPLSFAAAVVAALAFASTGPKRVAVIVA